MCSSKRLRTIRNSPTEAAARFMRRLGKEKSENGCVQIQQGICPRVQYGEQFILVVIEISR